MSVYNYVQKYTLAIKAPPYLSDFLFQAPARHGSNCYVLPRPRTDLFKTSLAFSGSSTWNALPPKLKTFSSLCNLKIKLRNFLHSALGTILGLYLYDSNVIRHHDCII